jgi:hypothetical protein
MGGELKIQNIPEYVDDLLLASITYQGSDNKTSWQKRVTSKVSPFKTQISLQQVQHLKFMITQKTELWEQKESNHFIAYSLNKLTASVLPKNGGLLLNLDSRFWINGKTSLQTS